MAQAIPFFTIQGNIYSLSPQATHLLEHLDNEVAIAVVLGEPASGKTTLINHMLNNNSKTPSAEVPISSMYLLPCHPNSSGSPCDILILEFNKLHILSHQHQHNLILLSLLISSHLIFNTKSTITESSITQLNKIASIFRDSLPPNEVEQMFPSLLWVLRDFDTAECFQTPKEYIQKCLQPQKGTSEALQTTNKAKRAIKSTIRNRDAYMMNHPQTLSQYTSYKRQVEILHDKIVQRVKPMLLHGRRMTARRVLRLVQMYLGWVNRGEKVSVGQVHNELRDRENERVLEVHVREFQIHLDSFEDRLDDMTISTLKEQLLASTCCSFEEHLLGDPEHSLSSQSTFKLSLEERFITFSKKNCLKWDEYYRHHFWTLGGKYLPNIEGIREVEVSMELVRREFRQETEETKGREQVMERLELEYLRKVVHPLLERREEQSRENMGFKEMYEEMVEYHKTCTSLHESRIETLETTAQECRQLLQLSQNKVQQLLASVEDLQMSKHSLLGDLQQHRTQTSEQLKKQSRLEREITSRDSELHLIKSMNETNCKEIERLNHTLKQSEISKYKLEVECKNKQLHVETMALKIMQKEEEIRELGEEIRRLIEGNARETTKQERHNLAVLQLKEEIKTLMSRISTFDSQRLEMESDIERHIRDKELLQSKLSQTSQTLTEELELTSKTIDSLKANLLHEGDHKQQLVEANQNLVLAFTSTQQRIKLVEGKNKLLEMRLEEEKEFKKTMKNAPSLQCGGCGKTVSSSLFSKHTSTYCQNLDNNTLHPSPSSTTPNPLGIQIKKTVIHEQNNRPFTVYQIQVTNSLTTWTIYRKYKDFCQLHSSLKDTFPSTQLSSVNFIVCPQEGNPRQLNSSERRRYLQQYLQQASRFKGVAQHRLWKEFIEGGNASKSMSKSSSREFLTRKHFKLG